MFKRAHIERFRGLSDLKIDDIKQFNLFVGKNNSGKTSILESLFVLVNPTNPLLLSRTNLLRGITSINETTLELLFHNFDIHESIKITADMDQAPIKRRLTIKPRLDHGQPINYQKDSYDKKLIDDRYYQSGEIPRYNGLSIETTLLDFDNKERIYESEIVPTDKGPVVSQVKGPSEYEEKFTGLFLSPDLLTRSQAVKHFAESVVKKRTKSIIAVLRSIEPKLENMEIGPDNMIHCDIGLGTMLPINVMGGGINKIFSIVMAIENTQGGVVFIDEIENGLFHTAQNQLWKAIFASAKEFNVQIFATTHSFDCVRALSSYISQEYDKSFDDVRVYRIERQIEDFSIVKYGRIEIELAIERNWDIR